MKSNPSSSAADSCIFCKKRYNISIIADMQNMSKDFLKLFRKKLHILMQLEPHLTLRVEGLCVLTIYEGEMRMYYKQSTGSILVRKSADIPSWVEWVHHSEGKTHCPECIKLNGYFFTEAEYPPCPHHPFCHCTLERIDYAVVLANATVDSKYSKYDVYLFNTLGTYNNHKADLFRLWGYNVDDVPWMKKEWERQAYEKYIVGDYKLNLLDEWGQRINIRIEIPRKDTGEIVSFMSGWMVYPNGKLQLATPYRR